MSVMVEVLLTCGLHHSLQDDHDLEVLLLQLGLGHVPEGRASVDLVGDHQGRDQEEAVVARLKAHADVGLVQRDELTCRRQSEIIDPHVCCPPGQHRDLTSNLLGTSSPP